MCTYSSQMVRKLTCPVGSVMCSATSSNQIHVCCACILSLFISWSVGSTLKCQAQTIEFTVNQNIKADPSADLPELLALALLSLPFCYAAQRARQVLLLSQSSPPGSPTHIYYRHILSTWVKIRQCNYSSHFPLGNNYNSLVQNGAWQLEPVDEHHSRLSVCRKSFHLVNVMTFYTLTLHQP